MQTDLKEKKKGDSPGYFRPANLALVFIKIVEQLIQDSINKELKKIKMNQYQSSLASGEETSLNKCYVPVGEDIGQVGVMKSIM